jgi:hypothetical protein
MNAGLGITLYRGTISFSLAERFDGNHLEEQPGALARVNCANEQTTLSLFGASGNFT